MFPSLSTSSLRRHWGRTQQAVLCPPPLHPLPTHRIRIEIRTPAHLDACPCDQGGGDFCHRAVTHASYGDTGGHYMRSGSVAESSTTGGSVSVLDMVFKRCTVAHPLHHYQLYMRPLLEDPANFILSTTQLSTQLLSLDTAHSSQAQPPRSV